MSSLTIDVVGARPGTHVEIVPGKTYIPLGPEAVQTVAICELVPAGDGTFRPVARICPRMFTVGRALKRLNITISEMTMRRLIWAGFVRGHLVTPGIMQFDYFSYLDHLRRVEADSEFWDRKDPGQNFTNRERYQQAV